MEECYTEFRNRWCEAKNGCACLGCVNVHFNSQLKAKGIEPVTKVEWERWMKLKDRDFDAHLHTTVNDIIEKDSVKVRHNKNAHISFYRKGFEFVRVDISTESVFIRVRFTFNGNIDVHAIDLSSEDDKEYITESV